MSELLEMVNAGISEIAEEQAQIDSLEQLIQEAFLEVHELQRVRPFREEQRSQALLARNAAHQKHLEAVGYAGLVRKKPHQKLAVQDVAEAKRILDQAEVTLLQTEKETREQDKESLAREMELQKQIHLWQLQQEIHQEGIQAMRAGLHKAHAQLGEENIAAFMQAYQAGQATVDSRLAELIEAQASLYTLYQRGIDALAAWPALRWQVERLQPWEDSTTRVLEATLTHVQTLEHDTAFLNFDVPTPWRLSDIIFIHEGIMRMPGELGVLAHRLQQTLDAYRAYMERSPSDAQ